VAGLADSRVPRHMAKRAGVGIGRFIPAFLVSMATASRWHDPPRLRTLEDDFEEEL
jgi:hypothetical protein